MCNCEALKNIGVDYSNDLNRDKIQKWVDSSKVIRKNFPDQTEEIISQLMIRHNMG